MYFVYINLIFSPPRPQVLYDVEPNNARASVTKIYYSTSAGMSTTARKHVMPLKLVYFMKSLISFYVSTLFCIIKQDFIVHVQVLLLESPM